MMPYVPSFTYTFVVCPSCGEACIGERVEDWEFCPWCSAALK